MGRHGLGLGAVLLGAILNGAIMTGGTLDLARPESTFGAYYDALGESLLRGRFDVPPAAIGPEAFVIGGRTYGYFGPTPALLRLPLDALFPSMWGRWTRLMMLAACALTLAATYLLVHQAGRPARRPAGGPGPAARRGLEALFVLCAALGTPLFFMMRSPVLYHEASLVAGALVLWTFVWILRYRRTGRLGAALAAAGCALLALHARASVGAGAMLAVGLLLATLAARLIRTGPPEQRPSRRRTAVHALTLALAAGACTSAVLSKNVAVFGNLLGAPPLSRHVQVMGNPARLALTDGGHFIQPLNVRTTLYNYLNPANVVLGPPYPFVHAVPAGAIRTFPETRLDHREPFASLTIVNPLWCVLAALGVVFVIRPGMAGVPALARLRIVLAGAAAGAFPILVAACITQRYLFDAYPLLIAAGAAGLHALIAAYRPSPWARAGAVGLLLLGLYTCGANVALTMSLPRWD